MIGMLIVLVPDAQGSELSSGELLAQFEENYSKKQRIKFSVKQNENQSSLIPLNLSELIEDEKRLFKKKGWQWQEIKEAVDFAANKTGVRKNFLIGMLVVESDLGRNMGKCSYVEVENGANDSYRQGRLSLRSWRTFLRRRGLVRRIARNLGYDYKELRVSCNPSRYVGTGGAMGVSQFMPDTWMEYERRVSRIVGKRHPDPWNLRDGIVAMALKLSDVPGVTDHNIVSERNAAKLYLSGTTSRRYDWYANRIQYWETNYRYLLAQA
ncbi:MAG: lytic murein transglycosylase [Patescibacteria group bacterium]|nr:lytic murein transglycosylase [Patescibacteria group bacterium]